jgi:hypothetical protein
MKKMDEIGFYLDPETHQMITRWCKQNGMTMDAFCRVAASTYMLQLIALQCGKVLPLAITPPRKGES